MQISNEDIKDEAIKIITDKVSAWKNATCFITDSISFQMREVIKQCRKNYWGVFNTPNDENTGQPKTFVPLTESTVDTDVKNREIDTKELVFKAKKMNRQKLNTLIREIIKNNLRKINFGEKLDLESRDLSIDGTAVWKIIKTIDKKGKNIADIKAVNLLNFYIDPTADNIQDTPLVIERAVMSVNEVKGMDGWDDTNDLVGSDSIDKNDSGNNTMKKGVKMIEIFEGWGLIPKYLISGNKKDKEEIEGHIVISKDKSTHKVHLIEENEDEEGLKPYEEDRYIRVSGRWYGRGIAEKLLMIQLWQNIIVNIRINRARISQLGMFKIKKGSNITAQLFSKLSVNGVIPLTDMNDLEQLVVKEASESSYKDEDVAQTWAERVTSAFEMVTGEQMPATTTATIGAIQSQSSKSQFVMIKKQTGMFLERVLRNHFIPIISKNIKRGDMVRISLDVDELREFDEQLSEALALEHIEKYGGEYEKTKNKIFEKLQKKGKDRYIEIGKNVDLLDFDVSLNVSNEDIDKNLIITNLLNMLRISPQYQEQIVQKVFDILGFNFKTPQPAMAGGMSPQGVGAGAEVKIAEGEGAEVKPQQSALDQLTGAVTR